MSIYSQTFLYLYRLLLFLPQKTGMRENISIIGRGIGQVMFQNNALSGIIMLIGIICNSWQLAILAVAGTVVGTIAASLLNYDKEDIRAGLYGFNGTLVGIAIGVFMEINIISVALLVIGAAITSWVAHCFRRQSLLPGFTAPFILVVWLLLITCHYLYPAILLPSLSENPDNASHFFQYRSSDVSGKYPLRTFLSVGYPHKLPYKRFLYCHRCCSSLTHRLVSKHRPYGMEYRIIRI